jgi:hypothetical protein
VPRHWFSPRTCPPPRQLLAQNALHTSPHRPHPSSFERRGALPSIGGLADPAEGVCAEIGAPEVGGERRVLWALIVRSDARPWIQTATSCFSFFEREWGGDQPPRPAPPRPAPPSTAELGLAQTRPDQTSAALPCPALPCPACLPGQSE